MATLDFTKYKKQFMTVKLNDDEKTILAVSTPKKEVFEALVECSTLLNDIENTTDENAVTDAINTLYDACAMALSNNKNRKHFTASDIGELFDLNDLMLFFTKYMEFIGEVASTKN